MVPSSRARASLISPQSNFFHAIRFVLNVLNDASGSLRQDERQRLLHEGAGHAVMSAYVGDSCSTTAMGRPAGGPARKVRLRRRSIGLKKDEYYLDKKHMTQDGGDEPAGDRRVSSRT